MVNAIYVGSLPEVRIIFLDGSDRRIKQGERVEVPEQEWDRMKNTGNFCLAKEQHVDIETPAPKAPASGSKKKTQSGGKQS